MSTSSNYRLHGFPSRLFLICLLLLPLTLSGCSMFSKITWGSSDDEDKPLSADALLNKGMDAYSIGDYGEALKNFKLILDEHPFSPQAMLAELKAADSNYYNKQYPEAKVLYKAFEEHHPTNEAVPYVMFQIGMCDYKRSDRIDRDISGPQDAIKDFTRLINAYPQSPYTKDAKTKISECKEFIINHEYMVAVFYVRTERYQEAQHRLEYMLSMYPESVLAPKARKLLALLKSGEHPAWGMNRWLPEFMVKTPEERQNDTKDNNASMDRENQEGR